MHGLAEAGFFGAAGKIPPSNLRNPLIQAIEVGQRPCT